MFDNKFDQGLQEAFDTEIILVTPAHCLRLGEEVRTQRGSEP